MIEEVEVEIVLKLQEVDQDSRVSNRIQFMRTGIFPNELSPLIRKDTIDNKEFTLY